ncbi:MAG: SLC13 family permease [bacterium]|nr:SLC13 family permease [bacterium]
MEMISFSLILIAVILFFISEIVRTDVAALLLIAALYFSRILTLSEVFSGFSGNAVVSVVCVMIIGKTLSLNGSLQAFTSFILKKISLGERRLRLSLMLSTGFISAFMQNIGAIALFLPSLGEISKKFKIPLGRLVMPIGFASIAGGALTMIASGPMIVLNDFLAKFKQEPVALFFPLPIGISALILVSLYFFFFSRQILPEKDNSNSSLSLLEKFRIGSLIYECRINRDSLIAGKTRGSIKPWRNYNIHLLAVRKNHRSFFAPEREFVFAGDSVCIIMGDEADVKKFAADNRIEVLREIKERDIGGSSFAEIMIPRGSSADGMTVGKANLRKKYRIEPIVVLPDYEEENGDVILRSGDTMIVFGDNDDILNLNKNDFILLTRVNETKEKAKPITSLLIFALSLILASSGVPLSISLLLGVIALILFKCIQPEQAYASIDMKVVVLLAALIPLGLGMQKSGASDLAGSALSGFVERVPFFVFLLILGAFSSLLSLIVSNVAAASILIPLSVSLAGDLSVNPSILALYSTVMTANSFILPTHQVNVFIMSVGGYKTKDFLKAGSLLSLLFLLTMALVFYFFYF